MANQVANLPGDSHCWASQQWHLAHAEPRQTKTRNPQHKERNSKCFLNRRLTEFKTIAVPRFLSENANSIPKDMLSGKPDLTTKAAIKWAKLSVEKVL